jgi:hypothetical protein
MNESRDIALRHALRLGSGQAQGERWAGRVKRQRSWPVV